MKVLVDTNVLLDVLAARKNCSTDSARISSLAEAGRILAHATAIRESNGSYIVCQYSGRQEAVRRLRQPRE